MLVACILVLPTGGGKILTAVRFLCTEALSDGYKVLWLAHTHHLLEQAFESLELEVKLIQNKQQLSVRVVSGTKGHFTPAYINQSAENQERNAFIAKTYADNQARYGKTIIFADRWFQCEQLRGFLEEQKKGIRVGTIYSHIDADPGSADARNKRNRDENAKVLDAFRNDQLDVLINVRMLTEGTDVPKLNTVFLTRQTRSEILLTQMVGRALRGPKFGGTDKAYIVSFIDNWQNSILWAISELVVTPIIESDPLPVDIERVAIQLISIDLVRQLVRQMDSGVNINSAPFLTFMPIGRYRVELETPIDESRNTVVQRLVMVFENEKDSYKRLIEYLKTIKLDEFVEANVFFNNQQQRMQEWQRQFFDNVEKHIGSDLLANLFHITQHIAQNDGEAPNWFGFEQRNEHNRPESIIINAPVEEHKN